MLASELAIAEREGPRHCPLPNTGTEAEESPAVSRLSLAGRIVGFALTLAGVVVLCTCITSSSNSSGFLMQGAKGSDATELDVSPLYQRLGGEFVIAEISSKFVANILDDKELHSDSALGTALDKVVPCALSYYLWEFLSEHTGGPVAYTGGYMGQKTLEPSKLEESILGVAMMKGLDDLPVGEADRTDFLQLLGSLKTALLELFAHVNTDEQPVADGSAAGDSLYHRIGGINALAPIVCDYVDKILEDPILDQNQRIQDAKIMVPAEGFKVLVTQFFAQAAGGPQKYQGDGLHKAKTLLGLTPEECQHFGKLLLDVLKAHNIDEALQQELVGYLTPLSHEILNM
eukprot:TRINITY_DN370_c0_g1_i1.p1 TRINITY_DN370_c0_g1~~TRINITY_DN370_c0_g1_i1.p1  ORF type:complete len:345 (+),score=76.16 TRINITY_DN370_c0_g1_i1:234-1268(+)